VKEITDDRETILQYLKAVKTKQEFRKVLCVWLRLSLSLTTEQIALALNMTPAAVRKLHSRYFKVGTSLFTTPRRGGRTWAYLDKEREAKLMGTFLRQAQRGNSLNVSQIQRAYEQSAGRRVSLSTIYRLIARHGMRRFLPKARATKKRNETLN
jgi:transposase